MISRAVVLIRLIHTRKTTLQRSFSGDLAAVEFIRCVIWFRVNFRSGRESKLSRYNNALSRLNTVFDYGQVPVLTLTRLDRPQINRVVRFHYEQKRTVLTDLHSLRRHQRRVFEQIENETHADNFRWPKGAVGIRRNSASFHSASACLNRSVNEIEIA